MSSASQILQYGPPYSELTEPIHWCAVQTRPPRRSGDVEAAGLGVTTFLPLVKQVHRWSDRQKIVEVAAILLPHFRATAIFPRSRCCRRARARSDWIRRY